MTATISLRLNSMEEKLVKDYADAKSITVSSLFRAAVLEKIENEIDLQTYNKAMENHLNNPSVTSFDDMLEELGI